ncbi:prostatic acid phosphatase [Trichogramma pretiosum]|uniref:prostatic acid phosphatase n=1 Tax=Trichogramma pretiosum TaxID=7493 RepID=UPI0006C99964|nr:prostatic acid phosphatase [Trichogramma pretiosum]
MRLLYIVWQLLLLQLSQLRLFDATTEDPLGKIIFANVLFRHGDRTPINPYPNDPYKNESSWPVPFGQLTNTGKHQHFLLGQWLRKRYADLLPEKYSPYEIYIRSTDVDRTLMSAEANLAGLYPPIDNEKWDLQQWMPIPVHTAPESEDSLLAGKKFCDKYSIELQKVLNSPEIKEIEENNAELFAYLSEKTGRKISTLETVNYLYSILYIESLYKKKLPEWTSNVYPELLKPLAELSFTTQAYNKILQRFKSGPLLKEMINHMVLKSKNALTPDRKVWVYSAHDDTVANLMMTLNVFEPHCPPYAATLLVELRLHPIVGHAVTVSYKNSSDEPTLLTIPGCSTICPLAQFIRLTKSVVPTNWEKECLMDYENYQMGITTTNIIALLTVSVLMLTTLIMIIILFVYWLYKREYNQYYSKLSMEVA